MDFDPINFLSSLTYESVTKKGLPFKWVESGEILNPLSYTIADKDEEVITYLPTAEGKEIETKSQAHPGDIIICGVSGEKYVVKGANFAKYFTGSLGGVIVPEQSARFASRVPKGTPSFKFTAPWGEEMDVDEGDLIVKDDSGFRRIRAKEAALTYNRLPSEIAAETASGPT